MTPVKLQRRVVHKKCPSPGNAAMSAQLFFAVVAAVCFSGATTGCSNETGPELKLVREFKGQRTSIG